MNAQDLIDGLYAMSETHRVKLTELEVNYRYDFDSNVEDVGYLFEDLYDEDTNSVLKSVVLVSVNSDDDYKNCNYCSYDKLDDYGEIMEHECIND